MIYAFISLIVGGILLGGAWSFHQQGKPWWARILLALVGLVAVVLALWRIQQG
ncbi:hypothetical protein [Brachybacterium nesterenkovii]|uniref:Uncharacterized protein n=1 Tax=Brachybacterium nesterenkovii TaxID=47847 RepID=A0A1X6WUB1_9MICO|nr:hypothetical protein [Brachybacterium nesterenkovii]SLM88849.1 hypothetical protein FM110_02575 [Brachybacterium nesterenkovii]